MNIETKESLCVLCEHFKNELCLKDINIQDIQVLTCEEYSQKTEIKMRYTIKQIADHNEETGGLYFSKADMKANRQTRASFSVFHYNSKVYIFAPMRGRYASEGAYSIAEYNPKTGGLQGKGCTKRFYSRDHVRDYIRGL